jgi:hypothetical protein
MGTAYVFVLGGLALSLVVAAVTAWLKGTLHLVGDVFRNAGHQAGETWTLGIIVEPALSVPAVFVIAAIGLAHPDSRWARWFYGEHRLARAQQRFDPPVP